MEDTKAEKKENRVTVAGNFSYLFFFWGLNVLYGIVRLILQIYLTNTLGIAAATVGFLFLVVKVWDAVNDPIFGIIIDKVEFKKGKFIPWIKLSTFLIPIATAFLFFCPISLPLWLKIGWVGLAYVVWDAAYTFCDAPISAMPIAMTDNIKERTALIFTGRIGAPVSVFFFALLPQMAGIMGYGPAILILSVFAMGVMLPFSYTAKERFSVRSEEGESVKSILLYIYGEEQVFTYFLYRHVHECCFESVGSCRDVCGGV
jgi:Na+/melibiose symporter-like transporter